MQNLHIKDIPFKRQLFHLFNYQHKPVNTVES